MNADSTVQQEVPVLEGKFSNSQVDEVLQTVIQGKGTGRLDLQGSSIFGGRVQAAIFIEDGRLVHVETAPERPLPRSSTCSASRRGRSRLLAARPRR